jgi:hypothetical protein
MFDGVLLAGVSVAALILGIELGLIPPEALPWIEVAVFGVGGSLAVTGLYDLAKKFFGRSTVYNLTTKK